MTTEEKDSQDSYRDANAYLLSSKFGWPRDNNYTVQ